MLDAPCFDPLRTGTVGVEEEVLVVDPLDRTLVHGVDGILARAQWEEGRACSEIADSALEFVSPPATDADAAVDTIGRLRENARRAGATLLAVPLHPTASFGDVEHTPGERYARIADGLRGIMRQTPHCGLHVHVGMPDTETTVRACNGMRKWLPLLVGLGANSPFWHGRDSGMASARHAIARSLPRSGCARAFASWQDYATCVREICAAGDLGDYTEIWWDLRPHPRLGTLEVRALDSQTSLADMRGLVALVHGLVLHEARSDPGENPTPECLDESVFRALRDGRTATFQFGGRRDSLEMVGWRAIGFARAALGSSGRADALDDAERMLREGNGAERQRAAFAEGGMALLLDELLTETRCGPVRPRPRLVPA